MSCLRLVKKFYRLCVWLLSCQRQGRFCLTSKNTVTFRSNDNIPSPLQIQLKQENATLQTLLEEKLHSLVKPEESMWSLHKGECLQVGARSVQCHDAIT